MFVKGKMTFHFSCELTLVENCHVFSVHVLMMQEIVCIKDVQCSGITLSFGAQQQLWTALLLKIALHGCL